jgi:hypothetical protein
MIATIVLGLVFFHNVFAVENFKLLEAVRINCRQEIIDKSLSKVDKSDILPTDRAENLVEDASKMIFTLSEMDNLKLLNKNLSQMPWSDSYWPLYAGSLGYRYSDFRAHFGDWKEARNYVNENPAKELIRKKEFDFLSPSEKYDFLLGLGSENLTKTSWAEGESYYKESGTVETWMGLCHGWAAASMMMPNPEKRVDVETSSGKVTFYPSDIKGLGTLLWAKGEFKSRFIGGRCNSKTPAVDGLGRPKESDCLDNNPGTWHLAIVNQIGVFDRSFIMDATYDYQVWNQPVYGYEYTYYNPQTKKESNTLAESKVLVSEWNLDKRKSVRAHKAKSIVGIKMRVTYVSENSPSIKEFQEANLSSVEYEYDLELDSQNKIIGGEWYSENHPDFLWVADKNAFPKTYGDKPNLQVDLNHISPEVKKAAAKNASYELPFGAVVRELFNASAQ